MTAPERAGQRRTVRVVLDLDDARELRAWLDAERRFCRPGEPVFGDVAANVVEAIDRARGEFLLCSAGVV